MSSPFTVNTITTITQAMMLEGEWRKLTEANNENEKPLQCFMSWEWLSQWLQSYQDYIFELKIICIMQGNEYISIAPFYISTNKTLGITTKTLSFIATNEPENCEVASEFIDIAYSDQHKQKIIDLLTHQLSNITDIHKFNFKDLHKDSLMYAICQKLQPHTIAYREHTAGYQFHTNMTEPCKHSASFLKKKKRTLNKFEKLSKSQNCHFIVVNNIGDALKLFKKLIELHKKRWEHKNKPGVFSNNDFYEFHKNFIRKSFEKGMIVLSAIQIENEIISVNYSITWHNTLYFYQSGIDESYKPNLSPGLLNHLLLIQYCNEQSIRQYNLLKSSKNDYKSQFTQLGNELINITMLSSNKFNFLLLAFYRARQTLKALSKMFR